MHELSIAKALIRLAEQSRPVGHRVKTVFVKVGPLQAIESNAMQWAWQATCVGTELDGALLELQKSPWTLKCKRCERQWHAALMDECCCCGSASTTIVGGDELLLVSLDVVCSDEEAIGRVNDVSKGDR